MDPTLYSPISHKKTNHLGTVLPPYAFPSPAPPTPLQREVAQVGIIWIKCILKRNLLENPQEPRGRLWPHSCHLCVRVRVSVRKRQRVSCPTHKSIVSKAMLACYAWNHCLCLWLCLINLQTWSPTPVSTVLTFNLVSTVCLLSHYLNSALFVCPNVTRFFTRYLNKPSGGARRVGGSAVHVPGRLGCGLNMNSWEWVRHVTMLRTDCCH